MQTEPITVRNPHGCRRLLAAILKHAVQDAALAEEPPRSTWPWPGWHPQDELQTFCQSDWFESLCLWLDLDIDRVRTHIQDASNGHKRNMIQLMLWE